jgi:transposase
LREERISFWDKTEWPPRSPDLNPIENIWSLLISGMAAHKPTTLEGLTKALRKVWGKIPQETIATTVRSMPERCRAVIDGKGAKTQF